MMAEMQKASGDLSAYQADLASAQSAKSQLESGMLLIDVVGFATLPP